MAVPLNEGGASSGTVSLYVTKNKTVTLNNNPGDLILVFNFVIFATVLFIKSKKMEVST